MRRPQKNDAEGIDEHNQPTEPINFVVLPYAPTATGDNPAASAPTIPAPPPFERPFPLPQVPPQAPIIGAYPFLPPAPTRRSNKEEYPAGGSPPTQPAQTGTAVHTSPLWQRLFPVLVGLAFVVIQMLLLTCVILRFVGLWNDTAWASILYGISDAFIWPIQTLLARIVLPFTPTKEMIILLAILLYGCVSRIIVRCLKLLLRLRQKGASLQKSS